MVKAVPEIPVLDRKVDVHESGTPDFQNAVDTVAKSSNTLSVLGAHVAQVSSNTLARQLGTQEGNTPHGNLSLPPLTDFDRTFADSYHTQAQATLNIQAEKLFADTQLQIAKADRITPDLIDRTHAQLATGLSRLSEMAPSEVRGKLDESWQTQLINNTSSYRKNMFTQQREDESNLIKNGLDINTKNALEFASRGDYKSAQGEVNSAIQAARSGLATRHLTPEQARVARDNAEQARINGMQIHSATQAFRDGKYAEWAKSFSESTHGLTQEQYLAAGKAVNTQINFLKGMQQEDHNLNVVKFEQEVAMDVNAITPSRILELKEQVSPLQYEKLELEYIKAKKSFNTESAGTSSIIAGFGDPEVFARGTGKQQDAAFDTLVARHVQAMKDAGTAIGQDEAEAQVAASAAGPVKGYIKVLNTKLASTSPAYIESAMKSISIINRLGKNANLDGLTPESVAMYSMYGALRRSMPVQDAAKEAYKAVYSTRTEQNRKMLDDGWSDTEKNIRKDTGLINYYTSLGGVKISSLIDPEAYTDQANQLLHQNYLRTNGDLDTAKKMTSDALKNSWGDTHVNGMKQTVFMPVEDTIGIPHDGVGYIQDDVHEFVEGKLKEMKQAFDAGVSPYYFEMNPRESAQHARREHVSYNAHAGTIQVGTDQEKHAEGSGMTIHKVWRNGVRETFPLYLKADPWLAKTGNSIRPYTAGWDVVMGTKKGYIPLSLSINAMNDVLVYKPDTGKIRLNYLKDHGLKA